MSSVEKITCRTKSGYARQLSYSSVEKITCRIKSGYARQLSYAGRVQIINAVLFSIYNFWGAVFILPQSVLDDIDKQCRMFLWGSSEGH